MKKIFLWGDYDIFVVGGIKYYKHKDDFLLLTVKTNKNFKHQKEVMIDSVKYIKSMSSLNNLESLIKYLRMEKPDFLAVVSGHSSVDTMQEFNKTKFSCEGLNCDLVVIKISSLDGSNAIIPYNIYAEIGKLVSEGV